MRPNVILGYCKDSMITFKFEKCPSKHDLSGLYTRDMGI